MHGGEKSDPAIVAMNPTNKADRPAAEPGEPRVGAEGNAPQYSTRRTPRRVSVTHALERIRRTFAVTHPRWEPYAGKPLVRICAGGAQQWASLPRTKPRPWPGSGRLKGEARRHSSFEQGRRNV